MTKSDSEFVASVTKWRRKPDECQADRVVELEAQVKRLETWRTTALAMWDHQQLTS